MTLRDLSISIPVAMILGSCMPGHSGDDRTAARGPSVRVVDSVELSEPDSVPIGMLSYVATRHGMVYIGDADRGRILAFDRSGRLVGLIGALGSGPGELGSADAMFVLPGDTLLAVMDPAQRALSVFDLRTRRFQRRVALPFIQTGQGWAVHGDTAEVALFASPYLVGRWVLTNDSVSVLGNTPADLLAAGFFYLAYGRPEVARVPEGWLLQLPAVPGLQLLDRSARPIRRLPFPAARRMGVPPDLLAKHRRQQMKGEAFQMLASSSIGMQRLSNGDIAVLTVDLRVLRPPPNPQFGGYRFFVSLVSADLSRMCVDGELPVATDATPMPAFNGDTLLFLSRLVDDNQRVRTTFYSLMVTSEDCEWVSIGQDG